MADCDVPLQSVFGRDERHASSSPRLIANAGAQVGTVMASVEPASTGSGLESVKVGVEPRYFERSNTWLWPSTLRSRVPRLSAFGFFISVSRACGTPPNRLVKNCVCDVSGLPSRIVNGAM